MKIRFYFKVKWFIFTLLLLFFADFSFSQVVDYSDRAKKLVQLCHYIYWIPNGKNNFTISIFGENPFGQELEKIFSNEKVLEKNVKIHYISHPEEIDDSNLIFITKAGENQLVSIIKAVNGKPILIVSDSEGLVQQGVHISFYVTSNKIPFEVNLESLKKTGLGMDAFLLNEVKIVKSK